MVECGKQKSGYKTYLATKHPPFSRPKNCKSKCVTKQLRYGVFILREILTVTASWKLRYQTIKCDLSSIYLSHAHFYVQWTCCRPDVSTSHQFSCLIPHASNPYSETWTFWGLVTRGIAELRISIPEAAYSMDDTDNLYRGNWILPFLADLYSSLVLNFTRVSLLLYSIDSSSIHGSSLYPFQTIIYVHYRDYFSPRPAT